MKKWFSFFLVCLLCISMGIPVSAKSMVLNEEKLVAAEIKNNHGIDIVPKNLYTLLDQSGNSTYVCVEFEHSDGKVGYAIVDLTSFEVELYSLYKLPPFKQEDVVIYGGCLSFAIVNDDNTATVIGRNKRVPIQEVLDEDCEISNVLPEYEQKEAIAKIEESITKSTEEPILGCSDVDSDVFSSGNNSGDYVTDCGINAAAMYLNYMDKYYDSGYLPANINGEEEIKIALSKYTQEHVTEDLEHLTGPKLAEICNGYTARNSNKATRISSSSYSVAKLKDVINGGKGKPCILRLPENSMEAISGTHFVIGLGHTKNITSSTGKIYVNSGWKSVGFVYISSSTPTNIVKE